MYDHGFMDNTNRQNGCLHDVRDASLVCESSQFLTAWRLVLSMKPWSYIWLEFGLFSTIIAIIRACACWALFVVTLTNTVHLIYIYIIFELNVFGPCGQSHAVQFAWSSAPPWSRTLRKHHPLMIRGRAWSSFDVIVPWVRLLVSRARRRTFEMALYHTSIILDIALWESPSIWELNNIFNNHRPVSNWHDHQFRLRL